MDQKTEVQQRRGDKLEWGPGRCCSRKKMTSRYYFLSFEQKSPILSSSQNISTFSHTRISDAYGNICEASGGSSLGSKINKKSKNLETERLLS